MGQFAEKQSCVHCDSMMLPYAVTPYHSIFVCKHKLIRHKHSSNEPLHKIHCVTVPFAVFQCSRLANEIVLHLHLFAMTGAQGEPTEHQTPRSSHVCSYLLIPFKHIKPISGEKTGKTNAPKLNRTVQYHRATASRRALCSLG